MSRGRASARPVHALLASIKMQLLPPAGQLGSLPYSVHCQWRYQQATLRQHRNRPARGCQNYNSQSVVTVTPCAITHGMMGWPSPSAVYENRIQKLRSRIRCSRTVGEAHIRVP